MLGEQLQQHLDATLGTGNLKDAVKLPTGEDLNEWADDVEIKKPIKVSGPKYVDYLMDWIAVQLNGVLFPHNFLDVVKIIFKWLFRIYAHIYHSHFQSIVGLGEEAHLNTCFKHFVMFTWLSS
ncbi:hypothetical protein GIB67_037433 [Kingdonia uniflora]|uniref:Uncharacterized protein n=1 Tax=Kingdonia uniflora TaxID=39325 RepID=A0A7J7LYB1_9MAGN|nr:hypothetical protein GIB67_037433 [Kingdonia uniflora]